MTRPAEGPSPPAHTPRAYQPACSVVPGRKRKGQRGVSSERQRVVQGNRGAVGATMCHMCESVSVGMRHIACARVSSPHTSTPRCKPNIKCARLQITCPDAQAEATHPFPFSLWVQSPKKTTTTSRRIVSRTTTYDITAMPLQSSLMTSWSIIFTTRWATPSQWNMPTTCMWQHPM
jgi:hypothetical protein